jgi:pimeloyl-ACP methyl ester carboxylesterase
VTTQDPVILAPEERPAEGIYQLADGRQVHLHYKAADAEWDSEWYFYREGDRVVRLNPLGADRFRSASGETIAVHASARIDDYRAEELRFRSGNLMLGGTLLRRPGPERSPAIVLMHGTFPASRSYYRLFGDVFLDTGVATLVFDKRGFGVSEGNRESTILQRADDAQAAIECLRSHPGIDPGRIGVWGFSNSTWSLPVVGSRLGQRLSFLVAVGPAGVPMARAETHRKLLELRQQDFPEPLIAAVAAAWAILYDYVSRGTWNTEWDTELPRLLERIHSAPETANVKVPDFVQSNPFLAAIPANLPLAAIKATAGGRAPDLGRDPARDYEEVSCPVLFMIGELDEALPATECAAAVRAALQRGNNRDHTVTVFPDTGHLMNVVEPGSASLGRSGPWDFHFATGFLEEMTRWVAVRAGLR